MQSPSPPFIFEYVGNNYLRAKSLEDHQMIQSAIYALFRLIYHDKIRDDEFKERSYWESYIPHHSMNMNTYIKPACKRLGYDPDIIWITILDVIYLDENDIQWYETER